MPFAHTQQGHGKWKTEPQPFWVNSKALPARGAFRSLHLESLQAPDTTLGLHPDSGPTEQQLQLWLQLPLFPKVLN